MRFWQRKERIKGVGKNGRGYEEVLLKMNAVGIEGIDAKRRRNLFKEIVLNDPSAEITVIFGKDELMVLERPSYLEWYVEISQFKLPVSIVDNEFEVVISFPFYSYVLPQI